MKKWIISAKTSRTVGKVCSYILLIFFACIFFMPFLWMLSTAVKPTNQIFLNPPKWIPDPIKWENFATIFKRMPLFAYTKNTLVVAILPVLGQIFAAPMIAYSLTKIPWKGAKYIFPLILATMMIPWQVTQIPLFITWSKLGLVNTFVPLVLPAFFGTPYYIYLMRQFVKGLPDSVIEAARIDGANEFVILYRVVYPMCKPVLSDDHGACIHRRLERFERPSALFAGQHKVYAVHRPADVPDHCASGMGPADGRRRDVHPAAHHHLLPCTKTVYKRHFHDFRLKIKAGELKSCAPCVLAYGRFL